MMTIGRALRAAAWFTLLVMSISAMADEFQGQDPDEGALKRASVSRLVQSLDPAVPIAIGKLVVRQASLLRARQLLADYGRRAGLDAGWNISAPEWQQAERALTAQANVLIESEIATPAWFYEVMNRETAKVLDAEEADYIATHFTTPIGREQRILLQMRLVAEVLMANYSFTNRIDYTVPGLENDLQDLSSAYWEMEPFRQRANMTGPESMKFAGNAAGLKFTRMLAINGIDGLSAHINEVSLQAVNSVDAAAPLIDGYVRQYRQRTKANQNAGANVEQNQVHLQQ
jgi:hypothetical protein